MWMLKQLLNFNVFDTANWFEFELFVLTGVHLLWAMKAIFPQVPVTTPFPFLALLQSFWYRYIDISNYRRYQSKNTLK